MSDANGTRTDVSGDSSATAADALAVADRREAVLLHSYFHVIISKFGKQGAKNRSVCYNKALELPFEVRRAGGEALESCNHPKVEVSIVAWCWSC